MKARLLASFAVLSLVALPGVVSAACEDRCNGNFIDCCCNGVWKTCSTSITGCLDACGGATLTISSPDSQAHAELRLFLQTEQVGNQSVASNAPLGDAACTSWWAPNEGLFGERSASD